MKENILNIEEVDYNGYVYNLEVEPNHEYKDDQFYLEANTGFVVHNCHPRDNIALRWLSGKLDLGYDLFESIMQAREVQAKNIALKLKHLKDTTGARQIWIHGKAYKPNVPYVQGSYSLLIGHYLEEMGEKVNYVDPLTGDIHDEIEGVVLLAHHAPTTYSNSRIIGSDKQIFYASIKPGSVVVDPWRKVTKDEVTDCMVIHYGNTR
jgi:UDPglucose 6-dehydrogenase